MPIRGPRSAMPTKGKPPTNIFSTNGKQKNPPTESKHKALLKYAVHRGAAPITYKS